MFRFRHFLEFFAGLEAHGFAGRDFHFFAGARVAADAGLARLDVENTEPTQLDPVTGYPDYCAAGTLGTLCATSSQIYNYGFANFAGFNGVCNGQRRFENRVLAMAEQDIDVAPSQREVLSALNISTHDLRNGSASFAKIPDELRVRKCAEAIPRLGATSPTSGFGAGMWSQ